MFKIININKPQGFTSNDVVQKIKHSLKLKKEKIGHLGTLDPFATGVLPITLGKATRLFDFYLNKDKEYIVQVLFGFETNTLDIDGEVTQKSNNIPSAQQIETALLDMLGKQMQMPPAYSAKKVNGKRAYELARQNKEVVLEPKQIEIIDLKLLQENANCEEQLCKIMQKFDKNISISQIFNIKIACSSGTYVRAFVRDLAKKLGTVATCTSLTRTKAGEFEIANAVGLEEFLIAPETHFLNFEDVLKSVARHEIGEYILTDFLNGKPIKTGIKSKDPFFITYNKKVVALCESQDGLLKTKTFLYDKEENK